MTSTCFINLCVYFYFFIITLVAVRRTIGARSERKKETFYTSNGVIKQCDPLQAKHLSFELQYCIFGPEHYPRYIFENYIYIYIYIYGERESWIYRHMFRVFCVAWNNLDKCNQILYTHMIINWCSKCSIQNKCRAR